MSGFKALRRLHDRLPRFGAPATHDPRLRLPVLDGIRGWAALMVVAFHIFWEIFGTRTPVFRSFPAAMVLDGHLAVSIFFVLSGEALSTGFLAGGGRKVAVDLALRRYPRLVIPILATCLIVYALQRSGLTFNQAAGDIVGRADWLGGFLGTPLTLGGVVGYSLYEVFVLGPHDVSIDPFLWTMRIEMIGSIVIFAAMLALGGRRWSWYVVGLATVLLLGLADDFDQLACFTVGLIFGQLRISGLWAKVQQSRPIDLAALACIACIAVSEGAHYAIYLSERSSPVVAIILVMMIHMSGTATRAMRGRLSQWLGRISFPLFLVQFPVCVSLTSFLLVVVDRHGRIDSGSALLIGLASLGAAILVAILFAPVEEAAKRAAGAFSTGVRGAWARLARVLRSAPEGGRAPAPLEVPTGS